LPFRSEHNFDCQKSFAVCRSCIRHHIATKGQCPQCEISGDFVPTVKPRMRYSHVYAFYFLRLAWFRLREIQIVSGCPYAVCLRTCHGGDFRPAAWGKVSLQNV
jgi:hypothetical protein